MIEKMNLGIRLCRCSPASIMYYHTQSTFICFHGSSHKLWGYKIVEIIMENYIASAKKLVEIKTPKLRLGQLLKFKLKNCNFKYKTEMPDMDTTNNIFIDWI